MLNYEAFLRNGQIIIDWWYYVTWLAGMFWFFVLNSHKEHGEREGEAQMLVIIDCIKAPRQQRLKEFVSRFDTIMSSLSDTQRRACQRLPRHKIKNSRAEFPFLRSHETEPNETKSSNDWARMHYASGDRRTIGDVVRFVKIKPGRSISGFLRLRTMMIKLHAWMRAE